MGAVVAVEVTVAAVAVVVVLVVVESAVLADSVVLFVSVSPLLFVPLVVGVATELALVSSLLSVAEAVSSPEVAAVAVASSGVAVSPSGVAAVAVSSPGVAVSSPGAVLVSSLSLPLSPSLFVSFSHAVLALVLVTAVPTADSGTTAAEDFVLVVFIASGTPLMRNIIRVAGATILLTTCVSFMRAYM